jgi:hypothetical protein
MRDGCDLEHLSLVLGGNHGAGRSRHLIHAYFADIHHIPFSHA